MRKIILVLTGLLCSNVALAGVGTGKVIDITIRTQDNLLLVTVENPSNLPACATWHHTYGKVLGGAAVDALYSALLTAQATGQEIQIIGTGACISGKSAEEIKEVNLGPWRL